MGPQLSAPQFYTCSFPGCPNPVRISLPLIESFHDLLRQTADDLQGVLEGVAGKRVTEVRGCRPVARFTSDAMQKAVKSSRAAVGYYRIRRAEAMQLDPDELAFAEAHLARPGSVVLLIKRGESPEANFFFREDGAFVNLRLLSFPLDATALTQRHPAAVPAGLEIEPRPTSKSRRILIAGAVVGLLAGGAGAAFLVGSRRPMTTPEAPAASSASTALPLRAERQGGDLKISWDLNSAAVASAVSGVLDIDDGGEKRRIPLDGRQIRFGSVLYTPRSDEVSVDLTALKEDGSAGEASVLVLLTGSGGGAATTAVRNLPMTGHADRKPAVRPFVAPAESAANHQVAPADPALPAANLAVGHVDVPALPEAGAPRPAVPAPVAPQPVRTQPQPQRQPPPAAITPPALVYQSDVRYPAELRNFQNRPLTVVVHATIDTSGRVTHADAVPQKDVHIAYMRAAAEAALRCQFRPARQGDRPIQSEATITFHFVPQSGM